VGSVADNLARIEERIQAACASCGRAREDVTLVCVSKTFPREAVQEAFIAGARHFGESRWQEAEPKVAAGPVGATWHFIGKLQSNKVKKVGQAFHLIHTIDSISQLAEFRKLDHVVDVMVEVNCANEEQKAGISPKSLDSFLEDVLQCEKVRFKGLMTVGPLVSDPDQSRVHFRLLAELGKKAGAPFLSMGMSNDFEVAIQEGATHIRVGSAIFGSRF
jgi:hypothetical protein